MNLLAGVVREDGSLGRLRERGAQTGPEALERPDDPVLRREGVIWWVAEG